MYRNSVLFSTRIQCEKHKKTHMVQVKINEKDGVWQNPKKNLTVTGFEPGTPSVKVENLTTRPPKQP